jgi:nitroreductase
MTFLELAKKRCSCRHYDTRPVEQKKLNLVLEAGRIAPSAANVQPWHFFVFRKQENIRQLWEAYGRDWFKTAPCVIVICGNHKQSWKRNDGKDHCDIDIAITTDHMTLQAAELGLGTCWICNFDRKKLSRALDLPDYMEPVVVLPLGYPLDECNPDRHKDKRKSMDDIVTQDLV